MNGNHAESDAESDSKAAPLAAQLAALLAPHLAAQPNKIFDRFRYTHGHVMRAVEAGTRSGGCP